MAPNTEKVEQAHIDIEGHENEQNNNNNNNNNDNKDKVKDTLYDDDLPNDLKQFLEGLNEHLPNDYMVPIDIKPNWLDIEKCKKGQQFAQKYYFGLNYAEMLSLYVLFVDIDNLGVLIYTQKSNTPFKAYKRYLSTVLRVKSWFETEFWNPDQLGYKNLKIVRAMHLNVSKKLNEMEPSEFKDEFSLKNNPKYNEGVWCPLNKHIQDDFNKLQSPAPLSDIWSSKFDKYEDQKDISDEFKNIKCPISQSTNLFSSLEDDINDNNMKNNEFSILNKEELSDLKCPISQLNILSKKSTQKGNKKIFINQFNMSMTQFGFVGLMLVYPDKFGASTATEEELEAFAHLWRAIGYYLGIKDRYNFCNGNYNDVIQRCKDVLKYWIIPNMKNVNDDWEHMSRCMTEGVSYYVPGVNFETSFKYLCWVLDLDTPKLDGRMSMVQSFMFNSNKFVMLYMTKIPLMLDWLNWLIKVSIKKASEEDIGTLSRLENKKYSYQTKVIESVVTHM